MPALPLDEAGKYVAAAYLVFLAVVLIYVAIMAIRLARIQRDIAELAELAERSPGQAARSLRDDPPGRGAAEPVGSVEGEVR